MSKIGVAIGEDFPVDERASRPQEPPHDDASAEWTARREAHRQWRAQRREWKRRWREEWRAHRRHFHEQYGDSYRGRSGSRAAMAMSHPFFWDNRALWRVLALVAGIALIVFAVTHIYFILGALIVAVLCIAAFRHGFDPFDLPPHDYDRHNADPAADQTPPADSPRDKAN